MAIAKAPKYIGAVNATPAYASNITLKGPDLHAGFCRDIARKLAVNCVDLNQQMSNRWMYFMLMETETIHQSII